MKVTIEMDQEEFRELLIPNGEKQVEFMTAFQKAAMEQISKHAEEYSRLFSVNVLSPMTSNKKD